MTTIHSTIEVAKILLNNEKQHFRPYHTQQNFIEHEFSWYRQRCGIIDIIGFSGLAIAGHPAASVTVTLSARFSGIQTYAPTNRTYPFNLIIKTETN